MRNGTRNWGSTSAAGATYVAYLPGPFLNYRLKTRNPFGGAEVLEFGVRAGFEGQLTRLGNDSTDNVYTTQLGATYQTGLPALS